MKNIKVSTRFRTASEPWFQNSIWNYDWTIFHLRNWQNMRYKQTSKQTNKQKLKISISTTRLPTTSQFWFQNSFWNHDWTIFLLRNWQNLRYIKWEKALRKMGKSKKTTFQWPKVSKLLTTLPRHRADIRTGLRFLFRAPEATFLKWGKAVKVAFSHSQNGHFRCPKRKSETCSDIRSVTWLRCKKFAHFRPLESGFLAFSHFT